MKTQFVILITFASVVGVGCKDEAPREEGPLARASTDQPTLTSSVPAAPQPRDAFPSSLVQDSPDVVPSEHEEPDFAEPEVQDLEPVIETHDGVTLKRLITAPSVEAREPVAPTALFGDRDEKIYAFLDVENASPQEKVLEVFFIAPSGKVTGGVALSIPAETARWRTWAFTRHADEVGLWRVEVRGPTGALLGTLPFEVAEGC